MGLSQSPVPTNLFLEDLKVQTIESVSLKSTILQRYVDATLKMLPFRDVLAYKKRQHTIYRKKTHTNSFMYSKLCQHPVQGPTSNSHKYFNHTITKKTGRQQDLETKHKASKQTEKTQNRDIRRREVRSDNLFHNWKEAPI